MALLLAGAGAVRAQSTLPPRWHPGDAPPDVEGVHLGDSAEQVRAVLGEPDPSPFPEEPGAALQTLVFRHGALMLAIEKNSGVSRIMLRRREGGALAGIRVGDRLGAMLVGWGEPTQSRGSVGRYQMGEWTITARVDFGEQKVLRLMLARTPKLPPTPPPPPPVTDTPPAAPAVPPAQAAAPPGLPGAAPSPPAP